MASTMSTNPGTSGSCGSSADARPYHDRCRGGVPPRRVPNRDTVPVQYRRRRDRQRPRRRAARSKPPLGPLPRAVTDTPRYRWMAERFGSLADQVICGCHVHVSVPDRDVAVQVSNHFRPWLPALLSLTANSPIIAGTDTGHSSWRHVLWARWPSAGPPPQFRSADHYDAVVAARRGSSAEPSSIPRWSIGTCANPITCPRSRFVSVTFPPRWTKRCCWPPRSGRWSPPPCPASRAVSWPVSSTKTCSGRRAGAPPTTASSGTGSTVAGSRNRFSQTGLGACSRRCAGGSV